MIVNCFKCNKEFNKSLSQIKKTKNNFCSLSCSASFKNSKIKRSDAPDKNTLCIDCAKAIIIASNANLKHSRCLECKLLRGKVDKNGNSSFLYKERICNLCKIKKFVSSFNRKYCEECLPIIYKQNGLKSAKSQSRRSKNEIYFAELCEKEFKQISTNEPIFKSKYGNWDADIIIFDHKIAVLWNGIWHYQKVKKDHSLKQVQVRDKIKIDVIISNSYVPYIIKDMGKFSTKFVENEFNKIKLFIKSLDKDI